MTLCNACLSFTENVFENASSDYTVEIPFDNWFEWAGSAHKCCLCTLIRYHAEKAHYDILASCPHEECAIGFFKIHASFRHWSTSETRLPCLETITISIVKACCRVGRENFYLDVWAEKNSPAFKSGYVANSERLSVNQSIGYFAKLRSWLYECVENHEVCQRTLSGRPIDETKPPPLPTRVIDVGSSTGSEEPRLVESNGRYSNFVALSHCWGPPEKAPIRTTCSTIANHLVQMPLSSLSKTFQDAVVVTRSLGLRYLWIDSLCIIQDDLDDWKREAPQMCGVYQNARITLAAASANDSSEGLFLMDREEADPVVELPFYPVHGKEEGNFKIALGSSLLYTTFPGSPLSRRAWVVQERCLSRRMIHFKRDGLFWVCRKHDDFLNERDLPASYSTTWGWDDWYSIVCSYFRCNMTKESDRMVAVEGIAHEFRQTRTDKYFMGIWMDDLPKALTWKGDRLKKNDQLLDVPSWTWLSMTGGAIIFAVHPIYSSADTYPSYLSETSIQNGKLVVRSVVKPGHLSDKVFQDRDKYASWDPEGKGHRLYDFFQCAGPVYKISSHPETSNFQDKTFGLGIFDISPEQEFSCLFLMKYYDFASVVLLVSKTATAEFKRVGLGLILDASWSEGACYGNFTLI